MPHGRRSSAMPASASSSRPAASTSGRATARFRSSPTRTRCARAACPSSGSTPPRSASAGRPGRSTTTFTGSFSPMAAWSRRSARRRHINAMARAFGATLRDARAVTAIRRPRTARSMVEAGGERYRAGRLVIAAGPGADRALAQFGVRIPLEVTKEQVIYFESRDLASFAFGEFPIWIWMDDPAVLRISGLRRTPVR